MKKIYIFLIIGIILIIGFNIFIFNKNKQTNNSQNNTPEYSKVSTQSNENSNEEENQNVNENNSDKIKNINTDNNPTPPPAPPVEEELASFSTKIYTKNDSARQKNLSITSSKLNGTIVEPNKNFSFTSTVGKASPKDGYEKADIYDENGNKVKGYGGGNCQISSTLYNVVLKIPSLQVIERHPHSKKVPYVQKGKDAAVAYGSVDFKFKNNNDYSIKIYCSVDKNNVNVRIVKLS